MMADMIQYTKIKLLALTVKLETCDFGHMDGIGSERNSRDQICEVVPHVSSEALVGLKQQDVRRRCGKSVSEVSACYRNKIAIQSWAFLLIVAAVAMAKGDSGA